jgi:1-acyl-sn-glycerol-3-phosphate acyltransferase
MAALPYGLGHEVVISFPGIHQLLVPLGAVRASHELASRLFREGHKVLVYPGGDLDAMRPYRARHRVVFGARRGYVKLAIRSGVPIIPVVTAGAQSTYVILNEGKRTAKLLGLDRMFRVKVWPLTLSLPWGLTFGPPPPFIPLPTRIFIEVLEPISFDRTGDVAAEDPYYVERCHHRVLGVMQTALERLCRDRRSARRAAGDVPREAGWFGAP